MARRCANCGQPALETDATCWHCGWRFNEDDASPQQHARAREGWQESQSLASIGVYVGLTLVVIVAMMLVMHSLGQRPLVQASAAERPGRRWRLFTDWNTTFTLLLPETWPALDGGDPGQQAALAALLARDELFLAGIRPLGELVSDLAPLFVAYSPPGDGDLHAAFLIVASSARLSGLSPEEAVRFLAAGNRGVREVGLVEDFERSHVAIEVEVGVSDRALPRLHCRQQYIHGPAAGWLVAACAPADRFAGHESTLERMLATFQRLDR